MLGLWLEDVVGDCWPDLKQALRVLAVSCMFGVLIDSSAVVQLLFPQSPSKASTSAQIRAVVYGVLNWIASFSFLVSFVWLIKAQRENFKPDQLSLIVLSTALAYLLFLFVSNTTSRIKPTSSLASCKSSVQFRNWDIGQQLVCGLFVVVTAVASGVIPSSWQTGLGLTASTALFGAGVCVGVMFFIMTIFYRRSPYKVARTVVQQKRLDLLRQRTYPAPYPNGWYRIGSSDEVKTGQVIEIHCLGKVLAVFRSEAGKIGVLDAYCPHMGANIAVGGKVKGDCVECPFHKWTFDTEGKVKDVPYIKGKVPEFAKTTAWPVREYYGQIVIYFDAEGREPPYELLRYEGIDSGGWTHRGSYSEDCNMHIQEFAENSADFQHFDPLHSKFTIAWTSIEIPFMSIIHEPGWTPPGEGDSPYFAVFSDKATLAFNGTPIEKSCGYADTTFMGPAGIVGFHFRIPDVGEIVMFQTHTPITPMEQHVEFKWFAEPKVPSFMASYVVGNWISQWRNDLSVWENKILARKPLLVRGDGPILRMRRWYSQFYSESSASVGKDSVTQLNDW